METRPLGKAGPRVSEIGICLPDGPLRADLRARAEAGGCRLFWHAGRPLDESVRNFVLVPYNLLDQRDANEVIPRARREGQGVVATNVLAGGGLAGRVVHAPHGARVAQLGFLVKPGRTLAQAAVQFVLANESVSAALVRVSTAEHLGEILSAPASPPLTGRELEQVFEFWANRFDEGNRH